MGVRAWLDGLGDRRRPLYGQVVLATALVCAVPLAVYFLTHHGGSHPRGERGGPVWVLSWLLPDAVLLAPAVQWACAEGFAVGAVLWLLRWGLPWSPWLAALGFAGVVGFYLESASQVTHVAHLTASLLIVHALWYHFYAADVREADRAGRFWTTPLYPQWVHALSVFVVGLLYGVSGLVKFLESGPGWANGVSLQLWVRIWGDPSSFWTQAILEDRRIALALQWVTLVGETSGFLAIVWPRVRPLVALLLVSFHIGQIAVFGWGFHANMAYLLLLFLPVDRWLEWWQRRREGP